MFQTLNSGLFGFIFIILAFAFLTANLTFWLRYLIGSPEVTSDLTADYNKDAILAFIGRWIVKKWQKKQIEIMQYSQAKAIEKCKELHPDLVPTEHQELLNNFRSDFISPNFYNALGICIYCFATWVSFFVLGLIVCLLWAFYPLESYYFYILLSLPLFWAQVLFFINLNYGNN